MVTTGPRVPMMLVRVAPIRLIASLVKKLGISVLNTASKIESPHNFGDTFSALISCVAKNWIRIKTSEDDIAILVKIKLPKREIKALLKITYTAKLIAANATKAVPSVLSEGLIATPIDDSLKNKKLTPI